MTDDEVGAFDDELATGLLEMAFVEVPARDSVGTELIAAEAVTDDCATEVRVPGNGDDVPGAELCCTEVEIIGVVGTGVGAELGRVKDGVTEDGPGLTTVTVDGLH